MKHPARAARFILPAIITLTVIGASAAAAAPAAASPAPSVKPATTFIWHPITLQNGWESASATNLVTGTPAWAISNGVVYLRGAIKQTNPDGSAIFGQLPKYPSPASNLYLTVWTLDNVPGTLLVGPDGSLQAFNGNADSFASLSGVSFPAASATMKVHKLGLEHGWASSGPNYQTGDPSYAISNGVVYLSGSMHRNTGTAAVAALLPKAARPDHGLYVLVYTFDGSTGWLQILPTGQIEAFGADAADYTSLAGVSYPAPGAQWHAFALEAGWKSAGAKYGTAAPAYTVINGVVYLKGSMYQPTGTTGLWTDLPAPTRTAADVLEIETLVSGGNDGGIAITDDLGLVNSKPETNAQTFASLGGIAYPQSS